MTVKFPKTHYGDIMDDITDMILLKKDSKEHTAPNDTKKLEIDKLVDEFSEQRRFDNIKEATISNDNDRIRVFLRYIYYTLNKTPETLTNRDYMAFFTYVKRERNCSDNTVNKYFKLLKVFYRLMKFKNFSDFVVESKERKRFSRFDIKHYDAIDEDTLNQVLVKLLKSNSGTKIRDATFIRLLWDTGCRVSEACNLTYSASDLNKGVFKLTHTKTKQDRTVVCSKETLKLLNYFLQHDPDNSPEDHLFKSANGAKLNKYTLSARFRNIVKELKKDGTVPKNQWLVIHSLRHGRAVDLLNKGVSIDVVKEYLGHASIETTLIYSHSTERKNKMLDQISKIL
ncbi:tyrosine-type recombinase/integrase [Methanococcus maripaludis]|uniref:Integrase/recombinase XerD n=3 Tax=Methanococcus maripaludis TaxID=39152 RepID=A0A7J9PG98_METMI|nr:tyrosine-type recombinase/integrase [Methanococcus maripaludis]MBA2861824.1 integrase/recombinase XerD [Methanococcus maripaludis]